MQAGGSVAVISAYALSPRGGEREVYVTFRFALLLLRALHAASF